MSNFAEIIVPRDVCIFCHNHKDREGVICTYHMRHEYPEPPKVMEVIVKVDKNLCTKCGLHPKNPTSQQNGCEHSYEK